jgi:Cys-tRNA synthase (O-phospho-L-seryl-tRNA:Cys-tRNA synthase)
VDALADMAVCRSKEAELLGYTQQVTEKNVTLQSEFSSVEAKVREWNDTGSLLYSQNI